MRVPFVDLSAQYQAHKSEFDAALERVIRKNQFIGGEPVREFEESFAEKYGVRNCISCGNGTDALYIALKMLGIGPGDEVITTSASWISTSETISQTGAKPVFVDVDDYFLIDTELLEKSITSRTRAVIPVHLYGQPVQMQRLAAICKERNLRIVEDCAQAHFAEWEGNRVGTFGDIATFSFYPGKNLGAWGDAGALITNDDDLARKCRMFANHGSLKKHGHEIEGINSRMDGLQAAILAAKLNYIDEWTHQRRVAAQSYDRLLEGTGDIVLPKVRASARHVYHLYVIKTKYRDQLKVYLAKQNVQTAIHYPVALPLLPAYKYLEIGADQIPVAARNQSQILSLPIFAELTGEAIEHVASSIKCFFADHEYER